jgi:small subunit ribosomal protein S16
MLAIRMQRTGRKGHAMFRVVVQDSRRTPTSGKVVAQLGSYDPHAKSLILDKEKAGFYLEHGAQPSDRIVHLLKSEGVKLPKWLVAASDKQRAVRHPDKRRSTAPAAPVTEAAEEVTAEASTEEAVSEAAPAEETTAEPAAETPAAQETTEAATEKTADEPAEEAVADTSAEAPAAETEPEVSTEDTTKKA